MRALPQAVREQIRKMRGNSPWLDLWRIQIDASHVNTTWAALVAFTEPVTHDGVTYDPYLLQRGEISEDTEGNLPATTLTIANPNLEPSAWLQVGAGLRGRPVELRSVHRANVDDPSASIPYVWTCQGVAFNAEAMTLDLEMLPLFNVEIPQDRFSEVICPHVYKSPICGYVGDLPDCLGLLSQCELRGADAIARGIPPIHPGQNGSFPGISSGVVR